MRDELKANRFEDPAEVLAWHERNQSPEVKQQIDMIIAMPEDQRTRLILYLLLNMNGAIAELINRPVRN